MISFRKGSVGQLISFFGLNLSLLFLILCQFAIMISPFICLQTWAPSTNPILRHPATYSSRLKVNTFISCILSLQSIYYIPLMTNLFPLVHWTRLDFGTSTLTPQSFCNKIKRLVAYTVITTELPSPIVGTSVELLQNSMMFTPYPNGPRGEGLQHPLDLQLN